MEGLAGKITLCFCGATQLAADRLSIHDVQSHERSYDSIKEDK